MGTPRAVLVEAGDWTLHQPIAVPASVTVTVIVAVREPPRPSLTV